jgi:hypothetical protein
MTSNTLADPTTQERKLRGGFSAAKEQWLKTVASYPNLSGADIAVAVWLSTYFNHRSHKAWPSLQRLAQDTNRNKSTVLRSMQRLEKFGLVEVVHGRGRKQTNTYRPKLGDMNLDPKTLRRPTTPRGIKRTRTHTEKDANSQRNGCELATRTLERKSR